MCKLCATFFTNIGNHCIYFVDRRLRLVFKLRLNLKTHVFKCRSSFTACLSLKCLHFRYWAVVAYLKWNLAVPECRFCKNNKCSRHGHADILTELAELLLETFIHSYTKSCLCHIKPPLSIKTHSLYHKSVSFSMPAIRWNSVHPIKKVGYSKSSPFVKYGAPL